MKELTKISSDDRLSAKGEFIMEKESLKIHFGGKDCIEIETLRDALDATLKSLEIIADKTLRKEDHCKFIIENVQRGSFEVIISVIKDILPEIISAGVVAVPGIVEIFTQIVKFRKALKGQPPKKIEDNKGRKEITNVDGNVTIVEGNVFNIYVGDSDLEKNLARMNRTISKDGDRTSLVVEEYDADGKLKERVEYDKADLTYTSNAIEVEKLTDDYEIQTFKSSALIKRACFSGEANWELKVTVLDRFVSVSIEDSNFMDKVQKGEISLSATTRIEAMFESKTRMCPNGESNGSTRYSLKRVLTITEREQTKQISIDDLD